MGSDFLKQQNIPLLGITVISGLILTFLLFSFICSGLHRLGPSLKGFLFAGLLLKLLLELSLLKTFLQTLFFTDAEKKLHEKD